MRKIFKISLSIYLCVCGVLVPVGACLLLFLFNSDPDYFIGVGEAPLARRIGTYLLNEDETHRSKKFDSMMGAFMTFSKIRTFDASTVKRICGEPDKIEGPVDGQMWSYQSTSSGGMINVYHIYINSGRLSEISMNVINAK